MTVRGVALLAGLAVCGRSIYEVLITGTADADAVLTRVAVVLVVAWVAAGAVEGLVGGYAASARRSAAGRGPLDSLVAAGREAGPASYDGPDRRRQPQAH